MSFLDDNYLLASDVAAGLYAEIRELPVVDAHNHADVAEIAANRNYPDIWQVEAATDHYVWELLRKRGVPERYLTGDAANAEKWLALAAVFDECVGNPTYEWVHLDLKRRFGIEDLVCSANGGKIWEAANEILARPEMRPQSLLKTMNVERMCSTDDPIDSLEHHRALDNTPLAGVVKPTFRPDRAMNIFKPDWREYVEQLGNRFNTRVASVTDLVDVLRAAHDFFADNGCVVSDHGVESPLGYATTVDDADRAVRKRLDGKELTRAETACAMSYLLNELAEMDAGKGWVFQIHMGAVRDVRVAIRDTIGPDSGGDVSDHNVHIARPVGDLLNRFDGRLKVVLYSLDPSHWPTLATLCRAFGEQVNLGMAWWFNDSPVSMKRQLEYVGTVDLLWNLAGMVTDSRKLVSYGSRTEMFRRVLADTVGTMVGRGQIPLAAAEKLVRHLAYKRPKSFFNL